MVLKNIIEDVVLEIIEEVIKEFDDKIVKSKAFKHDLACFVLNRIPQNYISGYRGVLHHELDFDDNVQLQADIIYYAMEGIKIIPYRRKDEPIDIESNEEYFEEVIQDYCYNFPYFVGKLMTSTTLTEIENVIVRLFILINNEYCLAKMINPKWPNPSKTVKQTKGLFAFWVKPWKEKKNDLLQKTFDFKLTFEHAKFQTIEKIFTLSLVSERKKYSSIRKGFIHRIPDVLITI